MKRAWLACAVLAQMALAPLALAQTAWLPDGHWQAPPAARTKANPLAGNTTAAAGGKRLFLRECRECHLENGAGKKKAADLRSGAVQQQTDGELFWKITNGNFDTEMPSFSRLPELQRWQLVLYLRQLHD